MKRRDRNAYTPTQQHALAILNSRGELRLDHGERWCAPKPRTDDVCFSQQTVYALIACGGAIVTGRLNNDRPRLVVSVAIAAQRQQGAQ